MRKILSALLAFILVLTLLPVDTYAAQVSESKSIIELDDGSYIEIRVEETAVRATNTKNGSKTYSYYDSNDNLEWTAKLSASFTYNGTTSSCTSGSCAVTIYETNWYEYSNTTTRSGSTATTALVMGRKFLGVTVSKPEYTITLTCDKDGNLS